VAKKEIAVKKYVVKLSAEERKRLEALIHAGKSSAQTLTRARILLKADVSEAGQGWSDSAISAALDTSVNNVARTRQLLVEEGFEATLSRKSNPNSARPRIFDGAAEAKLIALACSPAPEGFARWTLRLLEEKVVELNIVEKASDNTIGRTLKKRPQAAPQSAMGDPARSQCGLRRRHGGRAGNLPETARCRSSSRVPGRDLQAIDRRDAPANPAQARTTRSSRL
jgi:Homeodomain-like domain